MKILKFVTSSSRKTMFCATRCERLHSSNSASASQRRFLSSEALSIPVADGSPKVFSSKIESLVGEIAKLTLLEVADLNALLKSTLNIADAPIMTMGMMSGPASAQEAEEEEVAAPVKVQTSFTVNLNKYDETRKVALIKQVKALLEGINLVQAKKFVESLPATVKADLTKEEADKLKEALVAAGGDCTIE